MIKQTFSRLWRWWWGDTRHALKVGVMVVVGVGCVLSFTSVREPLVAAGYRQAVKVSTALGFRVAKVEITGLRALSRKQVMEALGLVEGMPLLAFSPRLGWEKLHLLGWVRKATVVRDWGGVVRVAIEEGQPALVWKKRGRFYVVNDDGGIIMEAQKEKVAESKLVMVSGGESPMTLFSLLSQLQSMPLAQRKIRAMARMGGKYWDVHLDDDTIIMLPDKTPLKAWQMMADTQSKRAFLDESIGYVDLRVANTLTVLPPSDSNSWRQRFHAHMSMRKAHATNNNR
ncbi:MAG: FtsQ-type POTRA domain-containing protein [Alphaproteobacteria bacterium GM202ARS2]|nr:FtsQ-type POTRA domain-containing protein [Alphaproteobacteria bacterium GM202ARS2]